MLPTEFQKSFDLSIQEKKRKIDFEDGRRPSWISDRNNFPIVTIIAIFDPQVTPT